MEQLIKKNLRSAERIVHAEAYKWSLPLCEHEDVLHDTLARVVQYWKPGRARDLDAYFLGAVYLNAKTVVMRLKGYHNGHKRPQAVKAAGVSQTYASGLYQPNDEGDLLLLDERIVPTVPSAEDVYLATVPSKRQVALGRAIQSLPERQRTVLTHQFYEDLSVAESAALLGLTNKQVSEARSAGIMALRRKLNA